MTNEKIHTIPFEKLHGHLKGVIERYAFYFTGRKQYVEDTAQEVFIKLWLKWPNLGELTAGELEDYIYTVTRNHLLEEQRQVKVNRRRHLQFAASVSEYCWHDQVLIKEGYCMYRQAVKRLSFKEKAIYFFYENDLSRKQIAAIVRRSPNTVNNQLYSASQTVKEFMSKYFEFDIKIDGRKKYWKASALN